MANMNRKWASGLGADGNPVYAPANVIEVNGRKVYNPTDKHYRAAGYLHVVDYPPPSEHREGYHWERGAWQKVDGEITRLWDEVADPPPPPRRWTRLSIKTALAQAEMLDAARQFLSSTEIATGYMAWEALTDCDYIEEGFGGEEKWNAILDGAAVALGKTRAEIDAFLANIPTEGGV